MRLCTQPGCYQRVVSKGRCTTHHNDQRRQQRGHTALGNRQRWRRLSAQFLRGKLCVDCKANGRITAATETDHVIPHRGDERLFWDVTNWAAKCKACHATKTARETLHGGRGADISPPASSDGRRAASCGIS